MASVPPLTPIQSDYLRKEDHNLRQNALEQANRVSFVASQTTTPEKVIERAEVYYKFLKGE